LKNQSPYGIIDQFSSPIQKLKTPPPLSEAGSKQSFHNALPWLKVEAVIKNNKKPLHKASEKSRILIAY
jgi:hypothetical protein